MSNTNPARGMRDFLPDQIRKRNYVIGVIKSVYEKYGFEPLETPSIENLSTLTNKYGEEGDQLMYKILKRGEKLKKQLRREDEVMENDLADLALRYDLTVPLARVVANYKNELPRFFKRYQIQPVWRADRPARGRYREFYQCDVDAIGSKSMVVEAELCSAVSEILDRLGFDDFEIRINHRNVLRGMLEQAGIAPDKQADALVSLDKIDKIGRKGVSKELKRRGISEESEKKFLSYVDFFIRKHSSENFNDESKREILRLQKELKNVATNLDEHFSNLKDEKERIRQEENIEQFFPELEFERTIRNDVISRILRKYIGTQVFGSDGLDDLVKIMNLLGKNRKVRLGITEEPSVFPIKIDPSLARGLSYYTGAIFEVVLTKGDFSGSIAGGGRYDGLIGMFGKEEIPAVGLSIGLERILYVMEERGMFPDDLQTSAADVLVTVWNEETAGESLKLASELRKNGLRVTVYPQADKLGKQFKYANQIDVPFVCVLGESEIAENRVTLKNMKTGEQQTVGREKALVFLEVRNEHI